MNLKYQCWNALTQAVKWYKSRAPASILKAELHTVSCRVEILRVSVQTIRQNILLGNLHSQPNFYSVMVVIDDGPFIGRSCNPQHLQLVEFTTPCLATFVVLILFEVFAH